MRRVFHIAAVATAVLAVITCMTACSTIQGAKDSIEASKEAGIEIEGKMSILSDGNFTYTAVIENTSDKTINNGTILFEGVDEEGNVVSDKYFQPGYYSFNVLHPGEKTAFFMDSYAIYDDGTNGFSETPADFTYSIQKLNWGDTEGACLTIAESERDVIEEDYYFYDLTIKNIGQRDFDWQKRVDEYHPLEIIEIFRDGEGKIIGGQKLYYIEYEDSGSYPTIPAGGEVTTRTAPSYYLYDVNPSEIESYELILSR